MTWATIDAPMVTLACRRSICRGHRGRWGSAGYYTARNGVRSDAARPRNRPVSTGALGGRVARRLADRGVAQRLIVRSVGTAPPMAGAIAVAAPSYADTAAMREALIGARTPSSFRAEKPKIASSTTTRRSRRPSAPAWSGSSTSLSRRRTGCDVHASAAALPHRGADPSCGNPVHLPAIQPLRRLRTVHDRR